MLIYQIRVWPSIQRWKACCERCRLLINSGCLQYHYQLSWFIFPAFWGSFTKKVFKYILSCEFRKWESWNFVFVFNLATLRNLFKIQVKSTVCPTLYRPQMHYRRLANCVISWTLAWGSQQPDPAAHLAMTRPSPNLSFWSLHPAPCGLT